VRAYSPTAPEPGEDVVAQRPQALMLTFLGEYLLDHELCVYSRSIIDVLGRVGVSEHATRSTLTRMVNRGLLRRQRHGQRMYFGLTERTRAILADGQHRLRETGAVNRDWNVTTCARNCPGPASGRCRAGCGSRRVPSTSTRSWPVSGWPPTYGSSTRGPTISPTWTR
jgi:PaaX-like protein